MQGDVIAAAEFFYKGLIPIGLLSPEAVVEVGRFQGDSQLFPQQIQGKEQRHGVRPAGNGAGHPVAGGYQIISPDEIQELIQHASTPGR